jgi:hypothetical protein
MKIQSDVLICDACRKPIRDIEPVRKIHGFKIHVTDECFEIYVTKVEKRILKVPFNMEH